mmetsp:Transcript_23340/g.26588  ORF Transcript_23340/g.26588 Transcript_23340/m.26588 type:complete len:338 (+) Transcript_23340:138-1151(+)
MILNRIARINIPIQSISSLSFRTLPSNSISSVDTKARKATFPNLKGGKSRNDITRKYATTIRAETSYNHKHILPTSSKFAFIASRAVENSQIDPYSIFSEQKLPPLFRTGDFGYVSPKWYKSVNEEDDKCLGMTTNDICEVAFIGRSNVGKSSLINSLMRKDLARSSKRPGRTQTFHYFSLTPRNSKSDSPLQALGFLVDLPGYGFAKAPTKVVSKWQEETQNFLLDRRDFGMLRRVFLLIDARRGVGTIDYAVMGWFDEAEIPYSIVLTKIDRVGDAHSIRIANELGMRYENQLNLNMGDQSPIVHLTSASKNSGIFDLMSTIDAEFISVLNKGEE